MGIWEAVLPGDGKITWQDVVLKDSEACEACVFDVNEVSLGLVALAGEALQGESCSRWRRASCVYIVSKRNNMAEESAYSLSRFLTLCIKIHVSVLFHKSLSLGEAERLR